MLKKLLNKITRKNVEQPVVEPPSPARKEHPVLLSENEDGTYNVVLGEEPMTFTLALMVDHDKGACSIVRNLASVLLKQEPESQMFKALATHGDVEPPPYPFRYAGKKNGVGIYLASDISNYELARFIYEFKDCVAAIGVNTQMLGISSDTMDHKLSAIIRFWNEAWEVLPEAVRIAASQRENSIVN